MKRPFAVLFTAIIALSACSMPNMQPGQTPSAPATEAANHLTPPPSATPTIAAEPTATPAPTLSPCDAFVQATLEGMTLREKAAQLFMLAVPAQAGGAFASDTQVGGYVLFADSITTRENTRALTDAITSACTIAPFIGIDEEGGVVSRLAAAGLPGYVLPPSAAAIGKTNDAANAYNAAYAIGETLTELGINLDFAPVADVLSVPSNTAIGTRSYGADAELVSNMVSAFMRGLDARGILAAPKHFPGHGSVSGDSHDGYVAFLGDDATLNETAYVPFRRAIAENTAFIMAGHITAPNIDPSGLPASLSPYFLTDVLRGTLGFEGIIITDAMNMGAIANNYTSAEASVLALLAGVDIILMPADFDAAIAGVLQAVEDSVLTAERLDASVARILRVKWEHVVH